MCKQRPTSNSRRALKLRAAQRPRRAAAGRTGPRWREVHDRQKLDSVGRRASAGQAEKAERWRRSRSIRPSPGSTSYTARNGGPPPRGTPIGQYRLHYEDGTIAAIPVVLGEDLRDWWNADGSRAVARGIVAWAGQNATTRQKNLSLRLYLAVWDNPFPEKKVVSIDFLRDGPSDAAPFCVAMTVEEPVVGTTHCNPARLEFAAISTPNESSLEVHDRSDVGGVEPVHCWPSVRYSQTEAKNAVSILLLFRLCCSS